MANTGWIDASNSNITFRGLYKIASTGTNSFTTGDMAVNGGGAELAIDIGNALIQNGTINCVIVKYTCYGTRTASAWKKATVRTGYLKSASDYSWQKTHEEAVGRGSSNKIPFEDEFTPQRATDTNKYHLLIGARNHIAGLTNSVVFSNISIYIDYTPHTHTTEVRNATAATCETDGYTGDTYCKTCGEKISSGTKLPALGHDYKPILVAPPTCTDRGYTAYQCSRCGSSYTDDYVAALGHTNATREENRVEATCVKDGSYNLVTYCSVCGTVIKTEKKTIPATGKHTYTDEVKQPTETENGYTTYTCQCGHSYVGSYTCLATFKNYDGSVLRTQTVNQSGIPSAPSNPIRDGYKFIGWSPAVGSIINSTVFTAMYEKLPPEFTSVQMLYQNKQISEDNKVLAEQFFRIVVGVKSYD